MFSYLILNNRCLFLFKFLCTYLFQVANLISKSYCVSFWPPSNCYDMKIIQEFIAIFLLDNVLNIWYVIKRFVFYLKKNSYLKYEIFLFLKICYLSAFFKSLLKLLTLSHLPQKDCPISFQVHNFGSMPSHKHLCTLAAMKARL